jgi:dTDP-4-amino-4,6-dideoxygalactose transaminase
LGAAELALLDEVIESGTLNCSRGSQIRAFEHDVAARLGVPYARAVTSGTAAIHTAVAATNPEPGDEIITTPVTDMNSIAPILYQQAIPVFADVDPVSLNVTADTVAARITSRTRAIIATHLFGNPCDVAGIVRVAAAHGIPVIEDATQAFLATQHGRLVGTIGTIGAFSLRQDGLPTTQEGGLVVTADTECARWMMPFNDRAWGYGELEPNFVALNYRMTDLQAAVARARLVKLNATVARRQQRAAQLGARLAGVPGLTLPAALPAATHVFSQYPLIVDPAVVHGGADALGARLRARGMACVPHYIEKPAFECHVLRDRRTYGTGGSPYVSRERQDGTAFTYDLAEYPGTVRGLLHVLMLPWHDASTEADIDDIADAVRASL